MPTSMAVPRVFGAGLIALAASMASMQAPAAAQTIRVAHWVPATHRVHDLMTAWSDALGAASGGRLTTQVFPAQQLGKAKDHYNMARDGIAHVTWVNPGYEPGRFPVFTTAELPFLMPDAAAGATHFDTWYRAYSDREMADVKYCAFVTHAPGVLHTNRPARLPEDVAGLKIRPANATVGRLIASLGGNNVMLSAPDSREAMERGIADGMTFPWHSLISFGIDSSLKYHLDAPFYVPATAIVLNRAWYEDLDPSLRAVIDDHCTADWARRLTDMWASWEHEGRAKYSAAAGHEITTAGEAELAAWRAAAEPIWAAKVEELDGAGFDGEAMIASLREALARIDAAVAD